MNEGMEIQREQPPAPALRPMDRRQALRTLAAHAAGGAGVAALAGCATGTPGMPAGWHAPEVLVPPSPFSGVHGLALDGRGRLLAGSVVGNAIWLVDRGTGHARVLVPGPEGQADDIAISPSGEMAWTSYLQGVLRIREHDGAEIRVLAKDLPGLNSLAFHPTNGRLFASQVFLGDAVWEIDVKGKAPPRLVARDVGGFNGFEVGPDGWLYGPLWFKGQVVKIHPTRGTVTVINSEFKTPAAANLDGKGNLWVVDARTGELSKVTLADGRKTVVAQLSTSLDNLAITPEGGTIYVSNMADNGIQEVDAATGKVSQLTRGKLAVPAGLKVDGGTLWVADIFAFRAVDLATGAVRDVHRMHASQMEYPFAVGLGRNQIALASWFTGSVQLLDRATGAHQAMRHGFKAPMDALPLDDGSLLVLELGSGSLVQASGPDHAQRTTRASGLAAPVQMVRARDGGIYVTEAATGQLSRIDLATGARRVVATGLEMPEGLAQTPWGSFIVAESRARRVSEIDPANGQRRPVAENLPIGLEPGPGLPPPYVVSGVAVGDDGSAYVSADRNNSVLRIRPFR